MTDYFSVLLKASVIRQLCSFFREKTKSNVIYVLKLISVKLLIQRIPLNRDMRFNLNTSDLVERTRKTDFFNPK